MRAYRSRLLGILPALLGSLLALPFPASTQITPPEAYLGFAPGADFHLMTYEEAMGYFETLASETDRMIVLDMGETSAGRRMKYGVISSAENLRRLDHFKEVNRRISLPYDLEEGEARGVEGFFLEVIAGNERALHLYRNEGYEPVETILYVRGMPNLVRGDTLGVRQLDRTEGENFLMSRVDGHLPWQCHPEYYREDPSAMYLGYRDGDELVGVLLGTEAGHIAALHVHPRFRGRGIGRRLVTTFWEKLNGEELRSAFFESSDLLRFFEGIGLKRTSLSQLHCVKK